MSGQGQLLVILAFVIVGVLPLMSLRRARLTVGGMLTLGPFVLAPVAVLAVWCEWLPGWTPGVVPRTITATVLALASVTVVAFTAGSHRRPLALWHQPDDEPDQIVTWGPYRFVRHPFYSGYVLAVLAAVVMCPGWVTLAIGVLAVVVVRWTAVGEERRLLASARGPSYADYRRRTGRFMPRPPWASPARG
jgi:protein-S-isoprenylcysteine O-methyltransferase Ste14